MSNLFKETYIKDIIEKNNIVNNAELNELINILASHIGTLTNPRKLENTFKSIKNLSLSKNTINNYIEYMIDAFKSTRYDIKGKKYIDSPFKYYFSDLGLRNVRLDFRQQEETHIMENIIYNELIYRGYNVDVGVVNIKEKDGNNKYINKALEVDFICTLGSKKYYIQSALSMQNIEKVFQEEKSLNNIKDSYKKIIIVKNRQKLSRDEYGITTIDIFDFLLDESSLDL